MSKTFDLKPYQKGNGRWYCSAIIVDCKLPDSPPQNHPENGFGSKKDAITFWKKFFTRNGYKEMKKERTFYTAREVADELRVNIMTVYRYIDAGKLKAYKIGKEFRIDKNEFRKFLKYAKR